MKLNDIFKIEQYDEAYKFVSENKGTTIKDLGNKTYQIVEIVKSELTIEEQNEMIRFNRKKIYEQNSDELFMEYQEALARGDSNAEKLKQDWLSSKDKVRNENPYVTK